jgi:hypothetical protein
VTPVGLNLGSVRGSTSVTADCTRGPSRAVGQAHLPKRSECRWTQRAIALLTQAEVTRMPTFW